MPLSFRIMLTSAVLLLFACENKDKSTKVTIEKSSVDTVGSSELMQNPYKEITTSTGKTIILDESHPVGASLSDFTVYFKGDTTTRLSLSDQDPMSSYLVADLDGNGFEELYIITSTAGSGSYGKICGFASNNDLSFSFIYFPELTEKEIQKGQPFDGYEGKDSFSIKGQRLVRSFQVNEAGEKKMKSIYYTLKKTEGGFSLVATP
ncbi:MAG: hypothetical protein ACK5BV_01815 [Bacteroidota bacterium]